MPLCPQNAYAANKCSLSDSFLDSLAGLTFNSYLAFLYFYLSFTIFLWHVHCNQVYMRYVLTTRMVKMAEKRYPHEDSMRVKGNCPKTSWPSQCKRFDASSCNYHGPCFKQKQKRWVLFCSLKKCFKLTPNFNEPVQETNSLTILMSFQ